MSCFDDVEVVRMVGESETVGEAIRIPQLVLGARVYETSVGVENPVILMRWIRQALKQVDNQSGIRSHG